MNTDTTGTGTTGTGTTGAGSPVTISEIAEFLGQLRALSGSSPTAGGGPSRDTTAERAAFLARKADLFARIAAHPDLTPPTPAPPAARPDGGGA